MLTPILIAVLSTLPAPIDEAARAKPAEPQKKLGAEATPKLECAPRKLKEDERSPEGERTAVLGLRGVLRSERRLRYRSKEIPAGAYTLSVVASDKDPTGRNLFIVLDPLSPQAKAPETPQPTPILQAPPTAGKGEADGGNREEKTKTPNRKSTPQAADGSLRALMRLREAQKPIDQIEMTIRPSPAGDRFSIRIQAGHSFGQVTIRLVEAK